MKLYVCPICGNVIELLEGNVERVTCCGRKMELLKAGAIDASQEKHVPVYEKKDDNIEVNVGSTLHPMEEDHYITWIAMESENQIIKTILKPHEEPKAVFPYKKGARIYAYCNNHGLWIKKVD